MKQIVVMGTDSLLESARSLCNRGEITQEQYQQMIQRNESLNEQVKKDIVILQ